MLFSKKHFSFDLPPDQIAQLPLEKRSASKLLALDIKTGEIRHYIFKDILDLLNPGDLLVFNNSKVIKARLFANKIITGGKVEILIERILNKYEALAHTRASKALKISSELILNNTTKIKIESREGELWRLIFPDDILKILNHCGHMPLPPYINREDKAFDQERYQTIYADPLGSIAAPTAGLHFDEELLTALQKKGIEFAFVTLHVGAGTFQPVRVENILEHRMHSEYIIINQSVCDAVKKAKAKKNRVIAVGTTATRCLETAAKTGEMAPYEGETDIFIYPGYQFKCVDNLITNFHLPESTLLMLVSALAGYNNIMQAYQIAIKNNYRFYSYGDAMFCI